MPLVGSVAPAYPRCRIAIIIEGGLVKKKKPRIGIAHARCVCRTGSIAWPEQRTWCRLRGFSPEWPISPAIFHRSLDRCAGAAGKAPGAFSHPTTPSAHPYVLMNYQGKPRDVDDARP